MAKIKKGDTVVVTAGADKRKRGVVLSVHPSEDCVVVDGVRIQKRHVKPNTRNSMPQGGILERPSKIHISNVRLYSEKLDQAVRVGFVVKEDGTKVRVARGRAGAGTELD
ncbi:MAG: 50S ribosomal protein L24 [Myxococcales bacterium]|nr:50S ribosomal protein L24 [Myxococcales bacterium]